MDNRVTRLTPRYTNDIRNELNEKFAGFKFGISIKNGNFMRLRVISGPVDFPVDPVTERLFIGVALAGEKRGQKIVTDEAEIGPVLLELCNLFVSHALPDTYKFPELFYDISLELGKAKGNVPYKFIG